MTRSVWLLNVGTGSSWPLRSVGRKLTAQASTHLVSAGADAAGLVAALAERASATASRAGRARDFIGSGELQNRWDTVRGFGLRATQLKPFNP